jgi:hypothetical protein
MALKFCIFCTAFSLILLLSSLILSRSSKACFNY